MPPWAAFQHLPSTQPAEPEAASDDLPLALGPLSIVQEDVFKTEECEATTPPEGSDEGYVCDSAFESVAANTKIMLFDEPPAVSPGDAGARVATTADPTAEARSIGSKTVDARRSGAKSKETNKSGVKASCPKADASRAVGAKAVGAKVVGAKSVGAKEVGAEATGSKDGAQASELSADPSSGRLTEREKTIIVECWKEVQAKGKGVQGDDARDLEKEAREAEPGAKRTGGRFGKLFSHGGGDEGRQRGGERSQDEQGEGAGHKSAFKIPQTFEEMGRMNAQMIGADAVWISMVISSMDHLVAAVVNNDDPRLLCEVTLLAIRGHKGASKPSLRDFQVCMMTSMRALVPHRWNSEHEKSWLHLWAIIEEPATPVMPLPGKYEEAVEKFVTGLAQETKHEIGLAVFDKMFEQYPKSESFFKQSNSRLCFIVARAIDIARQLFVEPDACVNEVLQLGLRHIMYKVPTDFFGPFAGLIADELEARCDDPLAAEGFRWSLDVVAYTMMRAVEEGSSPLLLAIADNDPKGVKKALESAGRVDRAKMVLHSETAARVGKKGVA